MRIAIILSCFNRIRMTERCLRQLYNQINENQRDVFSIYVFDDGSTDGTQEMIRSLFPKVNLIVGSGNYYWSKSMAQGMLEAVKEKHDLYLMLNDDVDFFDNALETMISNYQKVKMSCGIVGATKGVKTEECTYGGRNKFEKLITPGDVQECFWTNWNCFLIDKEVVNRVGIIDGKYQHAWGDYDYSYRMRKEGIPIYVADGYVGRCDTNTKEGTYKDHTLSKVVRLKKLFEPKGLPFNSYMRFHMRTQGKKNIVWFLYGYASIIGYILLNKEIQ